MRLLRYMLAPWAALLAYSFLSFFVGHSGIYARRHLEAERARLQENLSALEAAGAGLLRSKESLLGDDDALSVYARQLGFGRPGEGFVRVVGLGVAASVPVPSGHALYAAAPHYVPGSRIKLISLGFGAAVLLFFLVNDLHWLREPRGGWGSGE